MELLHRELQIDHECYASPLNRNLSTFCSVFEDTDRFFGSRGSFYDFLPESGCFECNPPFDQASVQACFRHVAKILSHSSGPLCIVVVIPSMDMNGSLSSKHKPRPSFAPPPTPARRREFDPFTPPRAHAQAPTTV